MADAVDGSGWPQIDLEFGRMVYREGVMDWRDIQRECDEWLTVASKLK